MNIDRIKIKKFSRIVSTQEYADKMKKYGENLIVTAGKQSGGKGTKGRSFSSEKGGVYLSSLLYYPNFPAEKSFLIMAGTCAAVCRTLEEGGLQAKIKWPNDVFVNGKKICGILTENTFSEPAAGDADGKHKDICCVCGHRAEYRKRFARRAEKHGDFRMAGNGRKTEREKMARAVD